MKRLILLALGCSLAGLLLSGCDKPAPPPPKKQAKARPEPKPKPVKPVKTAQAGTLAYLDAKNGFRDVNFGSSSATVSGLALVKEDEARHWKIFSRTDDALSLGDVPLKSIEYNYFDDKLCQVTLRWKMEFSANTATQPPSTELSAYCGSLYGRPTKQNVTKDIIFYAWHGQKAGVAITETRLPGVADLVKGGWAIPPTTVGEMVLYSIPLQRNANTILASENAQRAGGL